MFNSPALEWLFGAFAVAGVLWTLVKSVRVRVRLNVRRLTPEEAPPRSSDEPKVSFDVHTKFEQGKPIRFGTRNGLPAPPR